MTPMTGRSFTTFCSMWTKKRRNSIRICCKTIISWIYRGKTELISKGTRKVSEGMPLNYKCNDGYKQLLSPRLSKHDLTKGWHPKRHHSIFLLFKFFIPFVHHHSSPVSLDPNPFIHFNLRLNKIVLSKGMGMISPTCFILKSRWMGFLWKYFSSVTY